MADADPPDLETALARVEAAMLDADAHLTTDIGGQREVTSARLWRGQVLVDWEPDPQAGDCLLRAPLLRRLIDLHAKVVVVAGEVRIEAPGRAVAALSDEHAVLVRRLGGARRVELTARLRFADGQYVGGEETYGMVEGGKRRTPLLRLTADVKLRTSRAASPHTSPAST